MTVHTETIISDSVSQNINQTIYQMSRKTGEDSIEEVFPVTTTGAIYETTRKRLIHLNDSYAEALKNESAIPINSRNGIVFLDQNGKIPTSLIPSSVDDIVEGYYDTYETSDQTIISVFYDKPSTESSRTKLPAVVGRFYYDIPTGKVYRCTNHGTSDDGLLVVEKNERYANVTSPIYISQNLNTDPGADNTYAAYPTTYGVKIYNTLQKLVSGEQLSNEELSNFGRDFMGSTTTMGGITYILPPRAIEANHADRANRLDEEVTVTFQGGATGTLNMFGGDFDNRATVTLTPEIIHNSIAVNYANYLANVAVDRYGRVRGAKQYTKFITNGDESINDVMVGGLVFQKI